jgi:hypothetical protein
MERLTKESPCIFHFDVRLEMVCSVLCLPTIALTNSLGFSLLTRETTSYFYLGDTRQQTTALAISPIYITYLEIVGSSPQTRASPLIINAIGFIFFLSSYFSKFIYFSNASTSFYLSFSSIMIYLISEVINLQENPIFMAVSILSPVKTQTLMPCFISESIVSPT